MERVILRNHGPLPFQSATQCLKWTVDSVSAAFFTKIHDGLLANQEDVIRFTVEDLNTYRDIVMPLSTIATLDIQHEDYAKHGAVRVIRIIAEDCLSAIHNLDGRLAAVAHPDLFTMEKGGAQ